jgi:hypothetical protein
MGSRLLSAREGRGSMVREWILVGEIDEDRIDLA